MPDPIPSRSSPPPEPPDNLVELNVGGMTTNLGDTDPDRTGPHIPDTVPPAGQLVSRNTGRFPGLTGYEVLGELGRGGMGVVYKARHIKLNRLTALKMVLGDARAESKEIIRFLAEAEAVAAVQHPNVVGVYEFGEADGRPYLAMEFCPGGSLADKLKASRIEPRAAADLVRKLAEGVAAAHELGIVHRDLKPGNVLFDGEGEPRVSDFGLAKRGAGADLTQTNAVLGSPAYMSPEQAKGNTKFVGPQADVWAIGVILYECLTGRRPFHANDSWALLQKVIADEPAGVRTVTRAVPRDLDLVCRKCLAKAPHERYSTAKDLADDLARFLEGKPIAARPAGAIEWGWKWAKRNKPAVAVMGALALGIVGTTIGLVRANVKEAEAKDSEAKAVDRERKEKAAREVAEGVSGYMRNVLAQGSPHGHASPTRAANPKITVREAMDHSAKTIAGRFPGRPDIESEVRATVGMTYLELGVPAKAEEMLKQALDLCEKTHGSEHPFTFACLNNLGAVFTAKGDYPAAETLCRRALAGSEEALGPDHPQTLSCVNNLAALFKVKGNYPAAEPSLQRVLAGLEQAFGADHPRTLSTVNNLGLLYRDWGNYPAAEPLLKRALAGLEKTHGPDHPHSLVTLTNLATLHLAKKDYPTAGPLYRRALAGLEATLGPDHPETLTCVNYLALLHLNTQNYRAAEPLLKRALTGREKVLGPDHTDTLQCLVNLASLYMYQGKLSAAEPLLRRALAGLERAFGPDHPDTLQCVNNMGSLYLQKRDYPTAEPLLKRAVAGTGSFFGPDHPRALSYIDNLATLYLFQEDHSAAEPLLKKVLDGTEKARGPDHPDTVRCVTELAKVIEAMGNYLAAEPLYNRLLAWNEKNRGPGHPDTLKCVRRLAVIYTAMKRYEEAVPLQERAANGYAKRPELAGFVPGIRSDLGLSLLATGKSTDAESHLLAGYDGMLRGKTLSPWDRNRLRQAARGLVEVYEATNQPAKAAEWRAKLAALPPEVAPRPRAAKAATSP